MSFAQSSLKSPDNSIVKNLPKSGYTIVNKYRKLPRFCRKYLDDLSGNKFKICTKHFTEADINNGKTLATRHLVFIANSGNFYLIDFIHGGRGKHQHTLVIEVNKNSVKEIANLTTPFHIKLEEFLAILDRQDYNIQTEPEL